MPSEESSPLAAGVSVVIATRGRPELLRSAVRSVLEQDFRGRVELIVVFDQTAIDPLDDVTVAADRSLCTLANSRTPGLAGGRNTGILAAQHELVAFCDDDDAWLPGKLSAQIEALSRHPEASLVATGIRIQTDGAVHERLPPESVRFEDLLRSRITEIHPSSFLVRRDDLRGPIGLVDELLPFSYGEDYDLLLRAAHTGVVISVVAPLVLVNWNRASFFSERWQGIAEGLTYLLNKHPEFAGSPVGSARIESQIAFAYAASGDRAAARAWARRALDHDRRQLRAYAALLVSLRLMPAQLVLRAVNRRGHGL